MKYIPADKVTSYLEEHPLSTITFITGEEIVLNIEALDACRIKAKKEGFMERKRLPAEYLSQLVTELETPSLFATKRLIELHIDNDKNTKKNIKTILQLPNLEMAQVRLIVFIDNLDKADKQSWLKDSREDAMAFISKKLYPEAFAKNINKRLQKANLSFDSYALELFLNSCYGNLLAAKQIIDHLSIHANNQHYFQKEQLAEQLEDYAQFNDFAFSEAILSAQWLKAYRIITKIAHEAPQKSTLIIWLLERDTSLLLALHNGKNKDYKNYFHQYGIRGQQERYLQALQNHHANVLRSLLRLTAKLNRIDKGDEKGNFWLTLSQYLLLRAQS